MRGGFAGLFGRNVALRRFELALVLVVVAVQAQEFPVAAVGRVVVVIVVAVVDGEFAQVGGGEFAGAAAADPRIDLEGFFAIALGAGVGGAAGFEDEAIELANSTPYGLAAYFYTQSLARTQRVASRIQAGMVGVNRGVISDAAAPFGGIKHSGFGSEGGSEGIEEYLDTKYIALPPN